MYIYIMLIIIIISIADTDISVAIHIIEFHTYHVKNRNPYVQNVRQQNAKNKSDFALNLLKLSNIWYRAFSGLILIADVSPL